MTDITRNRAVGLCFAAVAVTAATIVATGVHLGVSTTALLLALSLVPPGIILTLWPASPRPAIAETLDATNTRGGRS